MLCDFVNEVRSHIAETVLILVLMEYALRSETKNGTITDEEAS